MLPKPITVHRSILGWTRILNCQKIWRDIGNSTYWRWRLLTKMSFLTYLHPHCTKWDIFDWTSRHTKQPCITRTRNRFKRQQQPMNTRLHPCVHWQLQFPCSSTRCRTSITGQNVQRISQTSRSYNEHYQKNKDTHKHQSNIHYWHITSLKPVFW